MPNGSTSAFGGVTWDKSLFLSVIFIREGGDDGHGEVTMNTNLI
jgi:hypothetical protein